LLNRAKTQFQAEDEQGRALTLLGERRPANEQTLPAARAAQLSLGVAPGAGFPAALPWESLWRASQPAGGHRWFYFAAGPDAGPPAKLVIEEVVRRTRVDVPFDFENLPLP
jgi:hypothetical protein